MPVPLAAFFLAWIASGPNGPVDETLWSGADISSLRAIQEEGLEPADQVEAYRRFIDTYPYSPLSEVALERCLELGVNVESVLDVLDPPERTWLVSHYRAHHELLAANPMESEPVSDGWDDVVGQRSTRTRPTRRAMRTSPR